MYATSPPCAAARCCETSSPPTGVLGTMWMLTPGALRPGRAVLGDGDPGGARVFCGGASPLSSPGMTSAGGECGFMPGLAGGGWVATAKAGPGLAGASKERALLNVRAESSAGGEVERLGWCADDADDDARERVWVWLRSMSEPGEDTDAPENAGDCSWWAAKAAGSAGVKESWGPPPAVRGAL